MKKFVFKHKWWLLLILILFVIYLGNTKASFSKKDCEKLMSASSAPPRDIEIICSCAIEKYSKTNDPSTNSEDLIKSCVDDLFKNKKQ